MAHLVPHRNLNNFRSEGFQNNVPQIMTRYINPDISDDDPRAESFDEAAPK